MATVSAFRGMAGEAVRSTLRLETWLSIIWIFAAWFMAGIVTMILSLVSPFLAIPVVLLLAGWIIGRFAIPASRGDFEGGITSSQIEGGEAFGFAFRLITAILLWAIPTGLIAWQALKASIRSVGMNGMMASQGFSPVGFGFWGIVLTATAVVFMIAPILSVIVATTTGSLDQVISARPWKWILKERWDDLTTFFAAAFGGMFLFFAIYLIPWTIIVSIMLKIAPVMGAIAVGLTPALPSLIAPILLGRLAGAFVLGGDSLEEASRQGFVENIPGSAGPAGQPATAPDTQPAPSAVALEEKPRIVGLDIEPDLQLIEKLRESFKSAAEVESGYLFAVKKGAEPSSLCAGIILADEIKLGIRQRIIKELTQAVSGAVPGDLKIKVIALDEKQKEEMAEHGLKVFVRKK